MKLAYDIKSKEIIFIKEIELKMQKTAFPYCEVNLILDTKSYNWVENWFQEMTSKGYGYKRDIHIDKSDALLHGSLINSYSSEEDGIHLDLLADYITIVDNSKYLKYYRDLKINTLLVN